MTDREKWTKDLSGRLQNTRRPAPVRHVFERIAALLHGDELIFTDNGLAHDGDNLKGRITVFTERFVAVADVDGVASMQGVLSGPAERGTVTVRVIPRTSLEQLSIAPEAEHRINSAAAWLAEEARDGWPYAGRLGLRYAALPELLLIPSDPGTDIQPLLPKLMEDLAH